MSNISKQKKKTSTETLSLASLLDRSLRYLFRNSVGETINLVYKSKLTMPQMITLHLLSEAPHSITEIADKLNLSRAAVSHMVERLVRRGFVVRNENKTDRRLKQVNIARSGLKLIFKLDQSREKEMSQSLSGLSPAVQQNFADILNAIISEFTSKADEK
jgi:DNA-binding MarR family transcriptional regulator